MVMGRHLRLQFVWLEQPLGGNILQTSHHLGDQPVDFEASSSSPAGAFFHNMQVVVCIETLQTIIMQRNYRKTPSSTFMMESKHEVRGYGQRFF